MDQLSQSSTRVKAVHSLWNEWAVSFGAITACILLSGFVIPKSVMPAVVLAIAWLLSAQAVRARRNTHLVCSRLAHYVSRILVISAAIEVLCVCAANISAIQDVIGIRGFNSQIPYISSLIIYPVSAIVAGVAMLRGNSRNYCRRCHLIRGHGSECDMLGSVFARLARRQLRILFWISVGISVIVWAYYLLFYINTNLNTPDLFFYSLVPAGAYVVSLIYVGAVYHQFIDEIKDYYQRHTNGARGVTELRFLVLQGDRLLLASGPADATPLACDDTPAKMTLPYAEKMDDDRARTAFETLSGLRQGFELRPLYSHAVITGVSNVYHYAAVVDDELQLPDGWRLGTNWATLDQLDRLMRNGALCQSLAAEIHRIFTVTMAWKTYDREGRRLYPIKNYRPTFRLRDFKDWDVDYADSRWLTVASENQDRPFYRLRRILRRITP